MSFRDEKWLSGWGAMVFSSILCVMNYDFFPHFWWIEYEIFVLTLALVNLLKFRRIEIACSDFYLWGMGIWAVLLTPYATFWLILLSSVIGTIATMALGSLAFVLIFFLTRAGLTMKEGHEPFNPKIASWSALGPCFSGVLTIYIPVKVLMFGLAVILDFLLALSIICALIAWLRRLIRVTAQTQATGPRRHQALDERA